VPLHLQATALQTNFNFGRRKRRRRRSKL